MKQLQKWLAAALIALLNQAVWADDVPDFQKTLQSTRQGNAAAQFNLGLMYVKGQGDVRQDYAEAVKWYRKAAEQKDGGRCTTQFGWNVFLWAGCPSRLC